MVLFVLTIVPLLDAVSRWRFNHIDSNNVILYLPANVNSCRSGLVGTFASFR